MPDIPEFFTHGHREGTGETYTFLVDDAPDWMRDAVRDAHGDEFPDDWIYEHCEHIVDSIRDGVTEPDEIADSLVDVYNTQLVAWLAGNPLNRAVWVDDAQEEGLIAEDDGLFRRLTVGQYMHLRSMAEVLLEATNDNLTDEDPDEEDE